MYDKLRAGSGPSAATVLCPESPPAEPESGRRLGCVGPTFRQRPAGQYPWL